ncbi:MAG TPA: hypothetical protein VLA68_02990 [Nitrososphaera sp.]|nr:hypothetical protein [Nitrososphaera sp.]
MRFEGIRRLERTMSALEVEIARQTEEMKARYVKAASLMPEGTSYYLNGVQTGSVVKAYLLTREGVGVQGEGLIDTPDFIENVMRFANYPKRKIEVLSDLASHLEKIYAMLGSQQLQ